MQNCLGVGVGGRNLNAGENSAFPPWESGWRLEGEPEPPQSPSGGESGFAPDKQAQSYGKRCFSRSEKENAAYFQPGFARGRGHWGEVFPSHPQLFSGASRA